MNLRRILRPYLFGTWSPLLLQIAILFAVVALLVKGAASMDYHWRWQRIPRYFFRQIDGEWIAGPLAEGVWTTLQLSAVAGIAATFIGIFAAVAALSSMPSLRLLTKIYVTIMRGTPLLVQLYLLYFMFGNALDFPRFFAGAAALALFEGAFAAEIFRSAVAAVPTGQSFAAAALGMSRSLRWRLVVLPQALPLILPPLANLFVSLIKHSSIVTIIAIAELTDTARNLISETFLVFELWLTVGALYIIICFPLAKLIGNWEQRLRARAI